MKITVYVPDDLAEEMKTHDDLNVSALTQAAVREELSKRETLARLRDKEMETVEVYPLESHGGWVRFHGRVLAVDEHSRGVACAWLTARGRIAIYEDPPQRLHVFDSFAEFAGDSGWREGMPRFVAEIGEELGERFVMDLDI